MSTVFEAVEKYSTETLVSIRQINKEIGEEIAKLQEANGRMFGSRVYANGQDEPKPQDCEKKVPRHDGIIGDIEKGLDLHEAEYKITARLMADLREEVARYCDGV